MKEKLAGIDRTLFELEIGILLFGAVCQLFVFLARDRSAYSMSLWCGILTAVLSALHMWWSLDRALSLDEKQAVKNMSCHNMLRYLLIAGVLVLTAVSGRLDPLVVFLGIMGLKVSVYLRFITRRISYFVYGEEVLPPLLEEPAKEQER